MVNHLIQRSLMLSNVNASLEEIEIHCPSTQNSETESVIIQIKEEKKYFNELVITRNRPTSVPFLSEEVRALADAEKFCNSSTLVLNNTHIETEVIVKDLLKQMLVNTILDDNKLCFSVDLAFEELFISNTDKEGDYLQFAKTINGFEHAEDGSMTSDPSWLVAMASLSWIDDRMVGITTTVHPINMGATHSSVQMLAIVLTPVKEKHTKSDVETSRNIAAVLSEYQFRQHVHRKETTEELFRKHFKETTINLQKLGSSNSDNVHCEHEGLIENANFGRGIYTDLKRRLPHYWSDYADAFQDRKAFGKTIITIFVMYFANLLPTIAFGMLNETETNNKMNVVSALIAQIIGGVAFAIFGGQQMIIMLTTSPLSLMIMVFYKTSQTLGFNFFEFYMWIGIFNTIYLCIYSFTGASRVMRFSKRSTEETLEFFITLTFIADAVKACIKSFSNYYYGGKCLNVITEGCGKCLKEESILFLFLLLGTMGIGLWLNGLTRTPFLTALSRKMLSEFALPVSVLFMSFIGSFIFREVKLHTFEVHNWKNFTLTVANIGNIPYHGILIAAGMAFPLSILFFMEQNIASSIINNPLNRLKKGASYHWDILVVAIINLVLSILGLPWVHGTLPHSPMHLKALATIEEHIDEGNHITQKVVKTVETRIPSIVANILVGCSIFMLPNPLIYIPAPVLNGLFLYMAFTSLECNQLFERLLLFITEQSAYPPNHYLRRVPQKKVHIFTVVQTAQLVILCIFGFAPLSYLKMVFPLILILQLPFRHIIFPKIIDTKYLDALDRDM